MIGGTAAIIVATVVMRIGRRRSGPALLAAESASKVLVLADVLRKLDEEDGVLLHDSRQEKETDHAEQVERVARDDETDDRPADREGEDREHSAGPQSSAFFVRAT
jgi:hypothetical protein